MSIRAKRGERCQVERLNRNWEKAVMEENYSFTGCFHFSSAADISWIGQSGA